MSVFRSSSLVEAVRFLNVIGEHLNRFNCRVDELVRFMRLNAKLFVWF